MGTLHDAFIDELRDTYDAEKQILKALPKLAKKATNPKLRTALENHHKETQEHVARLERAFETIGEKPKGKHCDGVAGIIEEGKSMLEEDFEENALDACIIASCQRVEHYEMAAYGTLVAWAKAMGHDETAEILEMTLEEEKTADETLTTVAEGGINEEAARIAHPEEESEEEEVVKPRGRSKNGRSEMRQ